MLLHIDVFTVADILLHHHRVCHLFSSQISTLLLLYKFFIYSHSQPDENPYRVKSCLSEECLTEACYVGPSEDYWRRQLSATRGSMGDKNFQVANRPTIKPTPTLHFSLTTCMLISPIYHIMVVSHMLSVCLMSQNSST
jgi:hypothetical protein